MRKEIKKEVGLISKVLSLIFGGVGVLLGIFLVVSFLIVLVVFVWYQYDYYRYDKFRQTQPFVAQVWKNTKPRVDNYDAANYMRCMMYKDLVKNKLKLGMDYDEVVKLLGDHKGESYFVNPESKTISYHIGGCTKQFNLETSDIRGYSLFLDFDRDSKLIGYGHNDDWREKKGYKSNKRESLFTCYSDDDCSRSYLIFKGPSAATCYSVCYGDEDCKNRLRNAKDCPLARSEECKKSEVESKWGYKVW